MQKMSQGTLADTPNTQAYYEIKNKYFQHGTNI
jgi:hypothetical protein